MGLADKCHLHIPYKRWAYGQNPNPSQEENNWNTLERWADNLLKRCVSTDRTCIYAGSGEGLFGSHGEFVTLVDFQNLGHFQVTVQVNVFGEYGPVSGGLTTSVSLPNHRTSHPVYFGVETDEWRSYSLTAADSDLPAGLQTLTIAGQANANVDIAVYYTIITSSCGDGTHYFGGG